MGLPTHDDNFEAYQNSELMRHASNLRTKKYLLVHGTADGKDL